MQPKSSIPPQGVVTYPTLVGKVLAQRRQSLGIKQSDLAAALMMSQSAYSRLESGDSVVNLAQLHVIAPQLGMSPSEVLNSADRYATRLRQQGVDVVSEKPGNPAAVAVGLGLLLALLLASA